MRRAKQCCLPSANGARGSPSRPRGASYWLTLRGFPRSTVNSCGRRAGQKRREMQQQRPSRHGQKRHSTCRSAANLPHQNVLRPLRFVGWLTLPLVFGLGVLVGREAVSPVASAWLPVTGVSEQQDTRPAPSAAVIGVDGESAPAASHVVPAAGEATAASKHGAQAAHAQRAAHAPNKSVLRSWSELAASAQRGTVGILAGERYGAGIIVSRSGLVLTNLHVVQGIDKVSALLLNDETAEAAVVEQAADVDLAL